MKLFQTMAVMVVAAGVLAASGVASAQSRNSASHVDFDDQLIQGQVNKGAVHLIERKDSDLGSLVKVRKSYRKEILAGNVSEPVSEAHEAMIAALPASGLPMVKASEVSTPAPIPAPAAAVKTVPAAKAAAKAPAAKKNESKSKGQTAKIGGSRAISRR